MKPLLPPSASLGHTASDTCSHRELDSTSDASRYTTVHRHKSILLHIHPIHSLCLHLRLVRSLRPARLQQRGRCLHRRRPSARPRSAARVRSTFAARRDIARRRTATGTHVAAAEMSAAGARGPTGTHVTSPTCRSAGRWSGRPSEALRGERPGVPPERGGVEARVDPLVGAVAHALDLHVEASAPKDALGDEPCESLSFSRAALTPRSSSSMALTAPPHAGSGGRLGEPCEAHPCARPHRAPPALSLHPPASNAGDDGEGGGSRCLGESNWRRRAESWRRRAILVANDSPTGPSDASPVGRSGICGAAMAWAHQ